ncbi:hypothetical protein V1477_017845 [Vespula maculifrons]|uniref:Ribosomal protein S3 n=1 Tax=Vespula maculifrons TaxID=7453 RepID=A0ABD2AZJ0_VESMC
MEKKHFSLTIFFSETIAPRRTVVGSLERARHALYAHIFFVQIGLIGADTYENLTGVIGKDSSRPLRPYFFLPDRTNRSRVITEKKHFSLTIFFSETIAPRRTGLGSLERARRALYAHIFFVQIGPIGAKTQENRSGVIGKDSSRPLRPYFFLPDRTNRSRVITHLGEPDRGHSKGLVPPSTPIFFFSRSDQQEPSYNEKPERGLWKGLAATCTPEPSYNGLNGTKEKNIVFNNFFLRNCSTQENLTAVIGKDSSRPLRPYFFRPDRTNRSRVITEPSYNGLKVTKEKKHFSLTIFFSETIAPRRTGLGSLERARRALYEHIFFVQIGPIGAKTQENRTGVIGKDSSRPLRPYFFRPDRTNKSRVITEPSYNGLKVTKEKKHFSLTIFFSETIAPRRTGLGSLERARRALYAHIFFVQIGPIGAKTQENRCRVIGKGSSRPVRPYFFRPDRINRSRVITHPGDPVWGHWKGLVGPCTHIFFSSRSDQQEPSYNGLKGTKEKNIEPSYNGLKVTKKKKHFSLTIFFSETIAPRRTDVWSLERAHRALYAHIFFVQIGPIGADTQENRSWVIGKGSSRPVRTYFFRPDRTNRSQVITHLEEPDRGHWKGLVAPSTPIFFSIQENPSGVIGKDSSRPLRPYFFLPDWTNRSRVITKNLNGVIGKDSSRPLRPYFFRPDRTNRSQVITHLGEPDRGDSKGLVPPSTPIFFSSRSDQQEPSYNDRTNRSRVITHLEKPERGLWKGLAATCTPIFFRPYRTNRSQVITHLEEPDRGHWKGLVAPSTPIFFSIQENPSGVIGKDSSRPLRPYFFLPDWTNRSRVITKNLNGVIGKDSSRPLRPYFFRPDRTNRSQVITHLGEPDRGHSKGLVPPSTPIFFSSRSDQQEPSYNDRTNRSRVIKHLEKPERGLWKGLAATCTPIFFRPYRTNRSRVITV